MQIKFQPHYIIAPEIINYLIRIERVKERIQHLPLTPTVLSSLRETTRVYTTHYSTVIEGNRLNPNQIEAVLKHQEHFVGREREEEEIKGDLETSQNFVELIKDKVPVEPRILEEIFANLWFDYNWEESTLR